MRRFFVVVCIAMLIAMPALSGIFGGSTGGGGIDCTTAVCKTGEQVMEGALFVGHDSGSLPTDAGVAVGIAYNETLCFDAPWCSQFCRGGPVRVGCSTGFDVGDLNSRSWVNAVGVNGYYLDLEQVLYRPATATAPFQTTIKGTSYDAGYGAVEIEATTNADALGPFCIRKNDAMLACATQEGAWENAAGTSKTVGLGGCDAGMFMKGISLLSPPTCGTASGGLAAAEWTFGVYGYSSQTGQWGSIAATQYAATLRGVNITRIYNGGGGGTVTVLLENTTPDPDVTLATCSFSCGTANGTVTVCTLNETAVPAGAALDFRVPTPSCGTTATEQVVAHFTTP